MNTDYAIAAWVAEQNAKQASRSAIFDTVCDKANWKMPIKAEVPADADLDAIADAIEHFTASKASFAMTRQGWIVTAAGYYATIGA